VTESKSRSSRVLILSGGVITPKEKSLSTLLKKQIGQWREGRHHWLELKVKANVGEPVLVHEKYRRKLIKPTRWSQQTCELPDDLRDGLYEFLTSEGNFETPELTEVSLAGLLAEESIPYDLATYDDLYSGKDSFADKLARCDVVFASSTFLRDLSELLPIIGRLKRPGNRIVVGGALMGSIHGQWPGHESIDLVAVGYGEMLIPVLAEWIKSGFRQIQAPQTGRVEEKSLSTFVFSGSPATLSLDFITRPDWLRSESDHATRYKMINYESVRGCPYRCSFCNYPYLFDDFKFRTKSAKKMAQDWLDYKAEHPHLEYITCLDSLFTIPKLRLLEFCQILIDHGSPLKWICYARADDLADEEVVDLMVRAGAIQAQIGIETANADILKNMNKRVDKETNGRALDNCRKYGLTSVVTLIVGFPGETEATVNETLEFLREHPCDFHFVATFSTRVEGVPILSKKSRERFDLVSMNTLYTVAPYWYHSTMDCFEATKWSRYLGQRLIDEKISLDAASFYRGILTYKPEYLPWLLDFQIRAWEDAGMISRVANVLHRWIDRRLKSDFERFKRSYREPLEST
jgi:anaerobic magnesium-protoporphyrin IX monomethyl ester cyclase